MQPLFRTGWLVLTLVLVTLSSGTAPAQSTGARNERAQLQLGQAHLRDNDYGLAEHTFNDLLRDYPQSPLVPDALYHLAAALRLQDRPDEAKKFELMLADKYSSSQWGQLILRSVLDDKELYQVANTIYKQARTTQNAKDASHAKDLFLLYGKRFPNDKDKKVELSFKYSLCMHMDGDTLTSRQGLAEIVVQAKDSQWGKLAAILLGDAPAFRERMKEFAQLCNATEDPSLFLEQAERYLPALKPEEALHCQELRGGCLTALGRNDDAVTLWTKLLKEQPRSPQAPHILFTLAEHHYGRKNIEVANLEYQRLIRHYPDSPEAALARRWSKELDRYDENWAEFERELRLQVAALNESNGVLAFKLSADCGDPSRAVRCRLAMQNKDRFVLEVKIGSKGVLAANDAKHGWYHKFGESIALRTDDKIKAGLPALEFPFDPLTGKSQLKFGWKMSSEDIGPLPLKLTNEHPARAVSRLQEEHSHLSIRTKHIGEQDEHLVYRFETLGADPQHLDVTELELTADKKIDAVRFTYWDNKAKKSLWTLSDVTIGGALTEEQLAVALPKGVEVRPTKELGAMELMSQMCCFVGMFFELFQGEDETVVTK